MKTIVALLCLQAAPADDWLKFKKDTQWTYERLENDVERRVVAKAVSTEGGKTVLEWNEYSKDGALYKASTVTWEVQDGVLIGTARVKIDAGNEEELAFHALKLGSKKGDSWKGSGGDWTHQGETELTVPAGTYRNAIRTRLAIEGGGGHLDFYLVPKVGLVRADLEVAGGGPNSFRLTEFKEPK
jgi:hypothetical protein